MTAFTRWIWHKTYQAFSCFPSRLYFDPECDGLSSVLWYLQISFESPMSITETTAFKWMMWHIIYQTCSCFPSRDCIKSQNAMVLVQTYGISRSHLNHRPPNVNITRHRSCSKSHEYLDQAWRDSVPAAPSYSGSDAGRYWSMFKRCMGSMGWLPNMNMIIEIAIPDQMVLMIRGHSFLRVKNLLRSIHVVDTLGFRVG